MWRWWGLLVVAWGATTCPLQGDGEPAAEEQVIYVSSQAIDAGDGSSNRPFRTLAEAQSHIRQLVAAGLNQDLRVLLKGRFVLDEPFVLGPEDAPPNGFSISWQAADLATPVVLSGGRVIAEWRDLGQGRWVAQMPDELTSPDAVASEGMNPKPIRQLFFQGRCLRRARSPNEGFYRIAGSGPDQRTSLFIDSADWQPAGSVADIELAYLHDWSMSRVRLNEFEATSNRLFLENRIGGPQDFFRIGGFEEHARYFLENDFTFLDDEDEFFFDSATRQLFLQLPLGESPNETPVTIPRLSRLLRISGTPEQSIRGLHLSGIQFQHTACPIPSTGYAGIQAGYFERREPNPEDPVDLATIDPVTESGHRRLPAAVEVTFAEDCQIAHCVLRHLGGGGIYLGQQTHRIGIEDCRLEQIGSCGIMIGETMTRTSASGQDLTCRGHQVRRCRIAECGQILNGAVGIWVGIARETRIEDNEICDLPYSGVSVGWRWDAMPSGCSENRVFGNRIHNVMQILSDGAGIYTLGLQPGTVIANNRIHDIPLNAGRAESNGIFMDEGSTSMIVEGNTIWSIAKSPIRFHKAGSNVIRNNRLHSNPDIDSFTFNSTAPQVLTFEGNQKLDQPPTGELN